MRNVNKIKRWCTALLGATVLAACSDDSGSPLAPTATRGALGLAAGEVATTVFTVGQWGGKFSLAGGHVIRFESNAICDPLTSGYGPSTWNLPCSPSRLPITITATSWTDASGHARVDFVPDLRFVPTSSGSRVTLQLRDRDAVQSTAALFYCPTVGECIDESLTDPTLSSKRDSRSGWVYRDIKHFSGYNVSTGRSYTAEESISDAEAF